MLRRGLRFLQSAAGAAPSGEKIKLYTTRSTYKVKVNGAETTLGDGSGRLITALRDAGFKVPSVCFSGDIPSSGGRCRICVCDVNGRRVTPCNMSVADGMDIVTESDEITHDRVAAYSLIPRVSSAEALAMTFTDELDKAVKGLPQLPLDESGRYTFEQLPLDRKKKNYIHILSRESPYIFTNIPRFFVYEKLVPWDCAYDLYDVRFAFMLCIRFSLQLFNP